MNFKKIRSLCTPAQVFLFIELMFILTMTYQNWGYSDYTLCVGDYSCNVDNKKILLVSKLVYVAFWTFILDLMCKNGYKNFAWMLLFLPVILFIVFIFLFMLLKGARRIGLEGLESQTEVDRLNDVNLNQDDLPTIKKLTELGLGEKHKERANRSFNDLSRQHQGQLENPMGLVQ